MEDNNDSLKEQKKVAYYSALVQGWLQTKMERDKSLLTLSTAAIGVLVILLTTKLITSLPILILFIIDSVCFLICSISILSIFNRNAKHVEGVINRSEKNDPLLTALDGLANLMFIIGLILIFIIGISIGIQSITKPQEVIMKSEYDKKIPREKEVLNDSWDGISRLDPDKPDADTSKTSSENNTSSSDSGQKKE